MTFFSLWDSSFGEKKNWNFEWMRVCVRREDFCSRQLVVSVIKHLLRTAKFFNNQGAVSEKVVEIAALLLQDDEVILREEVASILCKTLEMSFELCPQLVLWLVLRKFPFLRPKLFESLLEENDDCFFDPCVSNVYAESYPFGMEYFEDMRKVFGFVI